MFVNRVTPPLPKQPNRNPLLVQTGRRLSCNSIFKTRKRRGHSHAAAYIGIYVGVRRTGHLRSRFYAGGEAAGFTGKEGGGGRRGLGEGCVVYTVEAKPLQFVLLVIWVRQPFRTRRVLEKGVF